MKPYII